MGGMKHVLLTALKKSGFPFLYRNQVFSERWEFLSVTEDRHAFLSKGSLNPLSASILFLSTSTSCWVLVETEKTSEI